MLRKGSRRRRFSRARVPKCPEPVTLWLLKSCSPKQAFEVALSWSVLPTVPKWLLSRKPVIIAPPNGSLYHTGKSREPERQQSWAARCPRQTNGSRVSLADGNDFDYFERLESFLLYCGAAVISNDTKSDRNLAQRSSSLGCDYN